MSDTVSVALKSGQSRLTLAGVETPRLDAEVLLAHVLGLRREDLLVDASRMLEPMELGAFNEAIRCRLERRPVARITGEKEFWSLPFALNEATLVPRPDSEAVVEATLTALGRKTARSRILDLGTGSGCLLIALLSELPNSCGTGLDISAGALDCARGNAERLGVANRARWIRNDWLAKIEPRSLGGPFDIIICNPPYIATAEINHLSPEVSRHDPQRALDGGADGLDIYRALSRQVPPFLAAGGKFVVEVGAGQAEGVTGILSGAGLQAQRVIADLAGRQRVIVFAGAVKGN